MNGSNRYILDSNFSNNKSKSELQKIKHDLNNLLNNILNSVELINENFSSKDRAAQLLNIIKKNTLLASDLVSEISNSQNNFKEKISLSKVINDSIQLFNIDVKQESIQFIHNCKYDFILANYMNISRIILNIIKNSIEADSEAKITISLNDYYKNQIELIISDNGPGINSEDLKYIFDVGFSSKKSDKIEHGLGLSIVKELVDELSGNISVKSQLGKGTLFRIVFPTHKTEKFSKSFINKKIIIGEDDPFQLEVLKDLLTSLNIKTYSAANGLEVLDLLNNQKPDLIIIDRYMPIMDGIECIKNIKLKFLDIPIVLTSGSDVENFKEEIKISEVLLKPYSFETVQSILERLL
ncbi:MAG: hybrid sensor histidine kinase/response regulator [Ignavibacteriae bacterium]|nr:hybrid sensor histidine kinase/response regulator [Ignavibacteriota bacterium]